MKLLRKKGFKAVTVGVCALLVVASIVAMTLPQGGTATDAKAAGDEPKAEPRPMTVQEEALQEAEISNMVNILKTAILKGDEATREAMVDGLKGEPKTAEKMLRREIERSSVKDEKLRQGLEQALESIAKR